MTDSEQLSVDRIASSESGSRWIESLFGTARPGFAECPNMVVYTSCEFIEFMMCCKQATPGIWGLAPPFDKQGKALDVLYKVDMLSHFNDWCQEENQKAVLKCIRELFKFEHLDYIILDCHVPQASMEAILGGDIASTNQIWSVLSTVLHIADWVCVPIDPDFDLAVAVARDAGIFAEYARWRDIPAA